jgi:predicted CXXCH cytochrome family protein
MKLVKISVLLVAAVAVIFGLSTTSFAFHSGGVAECTGCHSMHNSVDGSTDVNGHTFAQGSSIYLLKGSDQGSTCLNCHNQPDTAPSSYHISTANITPYDSTSPVEMTPGGDFAWLKKTMSFLVRGNTTENEGLNNGHNIVATDYGYVSDTVRTTAPGSLYPADNLACSSCHDPHGRYRRDATGAYSTTGLPIFNSGSYNNSKDPVAGVAAVGAYRILGGNGYQPKSLSGNFAFTSDPMDVVVASSYNRSEATAQTGIAYGNNVSEWCGNCHSSLLQSGYVSGADHQRHPAGNASNLTPAIVANYNAYVSSGIMTNTTSAAAFSTLAPFQVNSTDRSVLKPMAVTSTAYNNQNMPAAATTDSVMCLSCHRAHASGFSGMLRYNVEGGEFMTIADTGNNAIYDTSNGSGTGLSQTQMQNAYYGRPATVFGPYARAYCNKCHAKD